MEINLQKEKKKRISASIFRVFGERGGLEDVTLLTTINTDKKFALYSMQKKTSNRRAFVEEK